MRTLIAMTCLLAFSIGSASSPITYQGQLQYGSGPFTGTPEMGFRLFDSLIEGNQVGDAEIFTAVSIEDGLFKVELDFGTGAFDGGARWLEIEVAGDILQPRQKITGSPWSHQALSVAVGSVGSDQIAAGAIGTNQADSDQIQLRITGTCAPGTTLAGINPDGSVACAVLPLGVAHVADSDGDVGEYTSIAIRENGLPIISYHDETNGSLKVFDCTNVACSSGTARTLDSDGNVGLFSAIAIRDNGLPIISYRNGSSSSLMAFDCRNSACSWGNARLLDSAGWVGRYTAIAIRADGLPIISYYDSTNTNNNLKVFSCGDQHCAQ